MDRRVPAYRIIFALAAAYNLAFGIWAGLFPELFFSWFGLDTPRFPSIWACVGMVVGIYSVAYAHVALHPDRGDLLVWVGFAGKVLGPVGWLRAVWTGELPPRTFPLILANDLVWWFPFAFYLLRRVRYRRAIIAWICAVTHLVACLALLAVRGGTEVVASLAERASWISHERGLWTAAWLSWVLASMSLLALCVAWGGGLCELSAPRHAVVCACFVCAAGLVADLAGETVNIVCLTRMDLSAENMAGAVHAYSLLGPGLANGLYCAAGFVLSTISWRVGFQRDWLGAWGFIMWSVGILLTFAAIVNHREGMLAAGAGVMILFIPWSALTGCRLKSLVTRNRNAEDANTAEG